jgi:hypothetical protein
MSTGPARAPQSWIATTSFWCKLVLGNITLLFNASHRAQVYVYVCFHMSYLLFHLLHTVTLPPSPLRVFFPPPLTQCSSCASLQSTCSPPQARPSASPTQHQCGMELLAASIKVANTHGCSAPSPPSSSPTPAGCSPGSPLTHTLHTPVFRKYKSFSVVA